MPVPRLWCYFRATKYLPQRVVTHQRHLRRSLTQGKKGGKKEGNSRLDVDGQILVYLQGGKCICTETSFPIIMNGILMVLCRVLYMVYSNMTAPCCFPICFVRIHPILANSIFIFVYLDRPTLTGVEKETGALCCCHHHHLSFYPSAGRTYGHGR